jgi:hypothetical protein
MPEKKEPFKQGRWVSIEALLNLNGVVLGTVVEGSMTKETFLQYLEFIVVSGPTLNHLTFHYSLIISFPVAEVHSLS